METADARTDLVRRLRAAGCVYAEEEAAILVAEAADEDQLQTWVRRRIAGEPLEPLVGWVEFAGRRLWVAPGVFVPRRRTELLARLARAHTGSGTVLVELCCGVAPVAATVQAEEPGAQVWAGDLDPHAVACAERNLGPGRVVVGDLYAGLPDRLRGRVDVIAANAPYVPSGQIAFMPAEARDHEHPSALDGGPDGTRVQAAVIAAARDWLAPGGVLLIECGQRQSELTAGLLERRGFDARVHRDDDRDATVVAGR